ncbi:MAG: 3-phosphoshikimate 1-carboxyvinyltransferase [Lachnospiraceae bacterium]|nr:3-phosphoshikimate 1-carboxyvinyltransferase [Lachnospiraceae bacterium]
MDEYINKLKDVRRLISKGDGEALFDLFSEARDYRNSIVNTVRISRSRAGFRGELRVPGDKSISHRAVMFGAIAEGVTHINGFLNGADCISTINCFKALGVKIEHDGGTGVTVCGVGLHGLKKPDGVLDCGNSGTTVRLMSGILAGQGFTSTITGDASIRKRPMKRIMTPLMEMGADISSLEGNDCAPLKLRAASLHGIDYRSNIASAQVKSAVLLAGLYAEGETTVTEPALSRNYTELMLSAMGADITRSGLSVTLRPGKPLKAQDITIPGDISSAAYFIGAALILKGSDLLIKNTGINPTRAGIIEVFKAMGGSISLENERTEAGERVADIRVKSSALHGTEISGDIIPTLIDELPLIAVVAAFAEGTTVIRDAAELKVKESDRIALVTKNLKAMGADIEATEDGFIINASGTPKPLHGVRIDDSLDHRIAMSFAVAGLAAEGDTEIMHPECVSISYPGFFEDLTSLS